MTTEFFQYPNQKIRCPQNSYEILAGWPIFWSENEMTMEFFWNSKRMANMLIKLDDYWILTNIPIRKFWWPLNSSNISIRKFLWNSKRTTNMLIKLDDYWIFYRYSDQKIKWPLNSSNIGDHGILVLYFCWNSSRIRCLQRLLIM